MTPMVTDVTAGLANQAAYHSLAGPLAAVVMVLLLVLLLARTLAEANGAPQLAARVGVFSASVIALLVAFGLFIVGRLWLMLYV